MKSILPAKLKSGDHVRVITPARSFAMIPKEQREISTSRFQAMGLRVSFGKYIEECDEFKSSTAEHRLEDLHDAFSDKSINAILTVIGGFNSNQLLKYIDYDLIRKNPKIFCGYSDITALQNAIFAKTGLVAYSGPHFSSFAMKQRFDFTLNHFKRCLFEAGPFELKPSENWSDDQWYMDQEKRNFIPNPGIAVVNPGNANGTIVGGNLCTFNLLHGTEFMPSLKDTVLFIEDDEAYGAMTDFEVDRNLQSIIHLPDFSGVKALVIGRFQKASEMSLEKITRIVSTKRELKSIPVIYGLDFGHTDPCLTFPIGGSIEIDAKAGEAKMRITEH
jgi:muramoyltetrapeptide carboxypeptidase LdcA involved in peptidoglycan recycling